jgi:hypothetical protein
LARGSDSRSFIVKDATHVVSKKLIHRDANPARIIDLQSKDFAEKIPDRFCGP